MNAPSSPASAPVHQVIHKYRFIILSLLLVVAGGLLHSSGPLFGWPVFIADMGVAFVAAGTVGLGIEYYTRKQFDELVEASVREAIDRSQLRRTVEELATLGSLGREMSEKGVRDLHRGRHSIDFPSLIEGAPPGSHISLLGVCLRGFLDEGSHARFLRKLEDGCRIRLLILDPEAEAVRQLADEERRDPDELRIDIQAASTLHRNLIQHRVPLEHRDHVELRYYASAPRLFVLATAEAVVVGPYLRGRGGEFFPHLELTASGGGVCQAFLDHFESLWDAAR